MIARFVLGFSGSVSSSSWHIFCFLRCTALIAGTRPKKIGDVTEEALREKRIKWESPTAIVNERNLGVVTVARCGGFRGR
jgi:hypothetical protein